MKENKAKMHYAWKIVIACILMKIGTGGATAAAMGNFVTPITQELGCGVSAVTMFTSVQAISMALLYTTAAKFLTKNRIGLVMGVASIAEVVGLALMATYTDVRMFYVSGAIIGIAQAFTGFVATPIVLNMWFKKKTGTVLGIIVAVGTAATILYTQLSAWLIVTYSWRIAYTVLAVMAAVITLPAVFFLIRTPQQVGRQPYGAEEAEATPAAKLEQPSSEGAFSLTMKQAFRQPLLYIAWAACVLYSYACGVAMYVTPFATAELQQSTYFGANVAVFSCIGGTLSSLIVGRINDKFGVKAGMLWGALTTALGYAMMFLGYRNPVMIYPAIFVVGLGNSMYMVQCPLLAQNIVGSKHYSSIWALMMMINSLVGGGLNFTIGLFYDNLGTYQGAFIMASVLYALAGILGAISINQSRRLRKRYEDSAA